MGLTVIHRFLEILAAPAVLCEPRGMHFYRVKLCRTFRNFFLRLQLLHGKAQAMSAAKGLSHREDARSVGRGDFTHGVAKHQGWHLTPPESRVHTVNGKKDEKKSGQIFSTLKDL